jgi:hypothetical protein
MGYCPSIYLEALRITMKYLSVYKPFFGPRLELRPFPVQKWNAVQPVVIVYYNILIHA